MLQAVAAATVHAMASQMSGSASSVKPEATATEPDLPGFKMLDPLREESSKGQKTLALMDQPRQSQASSQNDAASMIAALQCDLEKEKKVPVLKSKPGKKSTNKKAELLSQEGSNFVSQKRPTKTVKEKERDSKKGVFL